MSYLILIIYNRPIYSRPIRPIQILFPSNIHCIHNLNNDYSITIFFYTEEHTQKIDTKLHH